jgi:hypothetical protein
LNDCRHVLFHPFPGQNGSRLKSCPSHSARRPPKANRVRRLLLFVLDTGSAYGGPDPVSVLLFLLAQNNSKEPFRPQTMNEALFSGPAQLADFPLERREAFKCSFCEGVIIRKTPFLTPVIPPLYESTGTYLGTPTSEFETTEILCQLMVPLATCVLFFSP